MVINGSISVNVFCPLPFTFSKSLIETNVYISFLSWIILSAFTSPIYGSFIKSSLLAMLILIIPDVFWVIFFLSDFDLFAPLFSSPSWFNSKGILLLDWINSFSIYFSAKSDFCNWFLIIALCSSMILSFSISLVITESLASLNNCVYKYKLQNQLKLYSIKK